MESGKESWRTPWGSWSFGEWLEVGRMRERHAVNSSCEGKWNNMMGCIARSRCYSADILENWGVGMFKDLPCPLCSTTTRTRSLISNLRGEPALSPLRKDNIYEVPLKGLHVGRELTRT
jgi:hypothetical protein